MSPNDTESTNVEIQGSKNEKTLFERVNIKIRDTEETLSKLKQYRDLILANPSLEKVHKTIRYI